MGTIIAAKRFERVTSIEVNLGILDDFSIKKNILPRKEVKYGHVDNHITDQYFPQPKRTKPVKGTFELMRTKKYLSTEKITEFAELETKERNLIIPTMDIVHTALRENLNVFPKIREILILVKSDKIDCSNGFFNCVYLDWYFEWNLKITWWNYIWHDGVYVAFFSSTCTGKQ